jgi:hypothetical protein
VYSSLSKHILGIEPLNSPYKMIAADANKSNTITTFDIVELRKLILGIYQKLPNVDSWRFVQKDHPFHLPNNPFADTELTSGSLEYYIKDPNFNNSPTAQADFVGIKVGDVNNSVIPHAKPQNLDHQSIQFDVPQAKTGEYIHVPVTYTGSVSLEAYQFGLHFNPEKLEFIGPSIGEIPGFSLENFGLENVRTGEIRTLWMTNLMDPELQLVTTGKILFCLTFKVRSGISNSESVLNTDDSILENLAWTPLETAFSMISESNVLYRSMTNDDSKIYINASCKPNPSSGVVYFTFAYDKPEVIRLSILDASGNRVVYREIKVDKTESVVEIGEMMDLPAGIYTWVASASSGNTQGRLVRN